MNTIVATLFFCLLATVSIHATSASATASLRDQPLETLEGFVRSPDIDAAIRNRSLKELAAEQQLNDPARRRRLEDDRDTLKFFTIYDEFVTTNFTTLGETSASRGVIYNERARDEGLSEDTIEGILQGTCSLVTTDAKLLCSYEFFLFNEETGTMGSVVATGTVKHAVDTNSILLIEATGDEFVDYDNGIVIIRYTNIDEEQTIMDFEFAFSR